MRWGRLCWPPIIININCSWGIYIWFDHIVRKCAAYQGYSQDEEGDADTNIHSANIFSQKSSKNSENSICVTVLHVDCFCKCIWTGTKALKANFKFWTKSSILNWLRTCSGWREKNYCMIDTDIQWIIIVWWRVIEFNLGQGKLDSLSDASGQSGNLTRARALMTSQLISDSVSKSDVSVFVKVNQNYCLALVTLALILLQC